MRLEYSGKQNREKLPLVPELLLACLSAGTGLAFWVSALGLSWSPTQALSGNPLRGLLSAWNSLAGRLGEAEYFILPRFAEGYLPEGDPAPQGLFLTFSLLALILLSYLILRSGNRWLLLILLLPPAALMILSGISPGILPGAAFFGSILLCFCLMGRGLSEKGLPVDGYGRLWRLSLPAGVILLLLAGGMALDHFVGIAGGNLQAKASEAIEETLHLRYGSNPLGSGRLDRLDGEELTGKRGSSSEAVRLMKEGGEDTTGTALEIETDQPDAWYLRGFVGEKYSGGIWSELDTGTVYRQRDTLYWLNRQGFDGLSQMGKAAALAGQTGTPAEVKVETKKADRSLIYLPYEAADTDLDIPAGTENYGGNYLKSSRPFGSGKTVFSAGANMTGQWTDLVGGLYSAAGGEELDAYFINESHYNRWCYEQYTRVPARLKGEIYGLIGDPGDIRRNHAAYRETIEKILGAMEKNFIYSENIEPPEKGVDPLEQFLISGKGCDAHYASMAAMMFRSFGIPARYVEGYLVTPRDAQAGKTISIGRSHAHAWTEIYIDGFGWVPLEVTPEYEGIMPLADMERGLESVEWENRPQPENQMPPEDMEEDAPETQLGKKLLWIVKLILLILLALILLAAILWLVRRFLLLRARKKTFDDPDPRRGVCAMYGYMRKDDIPISEAARTIGDLAAFSHLEVGEGLRSIMREEVKRGENEKKEMDRVNSGTFSERITALLRRLRRG